MTEGFGGGGFLAAGAAKGGEAAQAFSPGDTFHGNRESEAHDNVRSMALDLNGYHVIWVTPSMIMQPEIFHKVALTLASYLGCRARPERFDDKWRKRCRSLRAEMLDYPLRWHRLMQAQRCA